MNTQASSWDALGGAYQLRPGHEPSIAGARPVLGAGRLAGLVRGQTGEQVGQTLTSVFTLCAHAHRRAADLALAAAQGGSDRGQSADSTMLMLETARDHLRMMALEWPQRVIPLHETLRQAQDGRALRQAQGERGRNPVPTVPDLAWLRDCPLPLAGARPPDAAAAISALRDWLEQRILLEDARPWLARHDEPAALALWCATNATRLPPAGCLAAWHPLAHAVAPETRCLALLDDEPQRQADELRLLAQTLAADPDFVQQPVWHGQCAETGPWARLRHRRDGFPDHSVTIWTRLASRWLELVEIATAGRQPAPLLASGALALGGREALAWCEMARGLLIHWVRLDAQGGVEDYRVLAPTEWNFHPAGALAQALARLGPGDTESARTLSAAYDPCVACTILAPH